jgi:hypothetical protein
VIFVGILAIFSQIRPVFCTGVYLTMKYGIFYGIPPEFRRILRSFVMSGTPLQLSAAGGTLIEFPLVYYIPLVVYITYRSKNRENMAHIAAI